LGVKIRRHHLQAIGTNPGLDVREIVKRLIPLADVVRREEFVPVNFTEQPCIARLHNNEAITMLARRRITILTSLMSKSM